MEKQFDDAGRALLGEVLRAQTLHRADECIGVAGHVQRVAIRAALMGARRLGATTLVAVDLSEEKLATARAFGATHTFNAGDPRCAEAIREATKGGVEFAFEMAGSVKAMELAYRITRRGGTTVTAGLPHPTVELSIPHSSIVVEERTIKGSYVGSCVPSRDIPRFIEWFQAGELPVDRLLSEQIGLEDLNESFDRLAAGRTLRQLLHP